MEFSPRQRGWKWIYFPPNQTAGGLGRPGCSVPGRHPDGLGCVHSAAPKAWPQSRASSWGIYRSSGPQLCSPNVTAETSTACDLLPSPVPFSWCWQRHFSEHPAPYNVTQVTVTELLSARQFVFDVTIPSQSSVYITIVSAKGGLPVSLTLQSPSFLLKIPMILY